jgi:6,7-dimethyl-8-ribityllumazine synthase
MQGTNKGARLKFAVVVARFNDFVTDQLEAGALAALKAAGVSVGDISLIRVPGAFEIPFAASQAALEGRFAAVICLGCLIRGATAHFEYIAGAASQGIMNASMATGVPMTFGVLTTNSKEEALERAVPGPANKGWEAAVAAVEMATLDVVIAGAAKRNGSPRRYHRSGRARSGRAGRGAPARKLSAAKRHGASGPHKRSGRAGRGAPARKK